MMPLELPQEDIVIDPAADLSMLAKTSLFYPCSGSDLLTPMALFSDKVSTLCFSDRGYFRPNNQDTRYFGLDQSAVVTPPVAAPDGQWSLKDRLVEEDVDFDDVEFDFDMRYPGIARLTESYRHRDTSEEFQVIRSNNDARREFDNLPRQLGVFFYRGDGLGEGGSGILWNDAPLLDRMLDKLVNGGLLVTDGSNSGGADGSHFVRETPVLSARRMRTAKEAAKFLGYSFKNDYGRRLTCIGYAGQRYGATLIWQVFRA
jgi:hypothetical protein